MRVFQDQYRGTDGVTRFVKRWSVELTDHLGTTRQIATGQRDKKTAEAIGRSIERLVRCRVSGEPLDPVTAKWLEGISPKLRTTLEKFGLLDAARMAALRPLTEHVLGTADTPGWKQYLASKGNTALHVRRYPRLVLRAFKGVGATYWSDISATRLMTWLGEQRVGKPDAKGKRARRGIGAGTFNSFVTALGGFGRWMQREGLVSDTPMASLRKLNAKTDKRRPRRPLDVTELRWLLDTTRRGPKRADMTGPERAMLYRLAVETGLRSSELASLTRSSFHLDGEVPTVTVQAAYSKRRRDDVLPLRSNTANDLREFLANTPPLAKAFHMPPATNVVTKLLRPDLATARQAWLDDADTTTPNEQGRNEATPDRQGRGEATPSKPGTPNESGERSERTTPSVPSEERKRREASSFLCYVDALGRYADFHALRHTTGTLLAIGGVNPKTAQTLMRHCDINLTMSLYTHTLAGQEAAAIATLPNFTTEPTRQKPKPPGTADVIPTTENAPETNTNNAPATDTNDAPSPPDNTPAETANIPTKTDAAPVRIDAPNAPENFPNNQGKNSPEKPEGICGCSELVRDESGRSAILEENTKKNENIVKVEHFPVKSQLMSVETEHPTNLFEKRLAMACLFAL